MSTRKKTQRMSGGELRDIRVRLRMTQVQFARALGIGHPVTISNYERGIYLIPEPVARLARTLR